MRVAQSPPLTQGPSWVRGFLGLFGLGKTAADAPADAKKPAAPPVPGFVARTAQQSRETLAGIGESVA